MDTNIEKSKEKIDSINLLIEDPDVNINIL